MVAINSAESNRASIYYLKEATWGTTPASGTVRQMRLTNSGLVHSKQVKTSQEIRADRMVSSIIETGASSGGPIDWEQSAGSQDDFMEGFLLGAWTRAMNFFLVKGSTVSITSTTQITLTGADYRGWLTVSRYIKVEGFANLGNNGYFTIGSVAYTSGNTVITVSESTPFTVEAGSAYSKVMDANDVILKSTTTAFEASNTINGGGGSSFAGQTLYPGQKIYLEGLGKETATITFTAAVSAVGDEFSLSDGVDTVPFEITTSASIADPGNVYVARSTSPGTLATNVAAAINSQFSRGKIRMSAVLSAGTKETGSIAFGSVADNGDTVTIDDGASGAVVFTFAASGNGLTGAAVNVATGGSAAASATNLKAAIDANTLLDLTVVDDLGGNLAITNERYDGGAITKSDGDNDYVVTDFSGGALPTVVVKNHRRTGGVITETLSCMTAGSFSGGSATKGGIYTIASLPDTDTIIVTETLSTDANGGGLMVVIKGSHLRNPGTPADITKQSFSIETGFEDVGKYFQMTGQRVGEFDKKVQAGDIVTGKFQMTGGETTHSADSVLNDTVTYTVLDSTSTEVMNATSNVGSITKDGETLELAVMSINLKGTNNLREQRAVGEKFPAGVGYGRFALSGNIDVYFEDFTFYEAFYNHDTVSLSFNFSDVDNNTYYETIPALKITSDPISPTGIDKDVMENMNWQAQRDAALGTQYMIDRFSSLYPFSRPS